VINAVSENSIWSKSDGRILLSYEFGRKAVKLTALTWDIIAINLIHNLASPNIYIYMCVCVCIYMCVCVCVCNYWGSSVRVLSNRSTTHEIFCIRYILEKE
jgi:hypothetical protein